MSRMLKFSSRASRAFSVPGAGEPFAAWDAGYGFDPSSGLWLSKNNNLVFNQATPASVPSKTASSANFGGKPAISTTSTQGMQSTLAPSAWNFLHNGNGMTVFTAQYLNDSTQNSVLNSYQGSGGGGLDLVQWHAAGGCFQRIANGAGTYWVNEATATLYQLAGVFGFRSSLANGARYKIRSGSWTACTTSGSPTSNNADLTLAFGARGSVKWVGELAEILVWNRYLTDDESAAVYSYLATKYGW